MHITIFNIFQRPAAFLKPLATGHVMMRTILLSVILMAAIAVEMFGSTIVPSVNVLMTVGFQKTTILKEMASALTIGLVTIFVTRRTMRQHANMMEGIVLKINIANTIQWTMAFVTKLTTRRSASTMEATVLSIKVCVLSVNH